MTEPLPIAQLEPYGLSIRLINRLEERYDVMFLHQLQRGHLFQMRSDSVVGRSGVDVLLKSLANYRDGKTVKTANEMLYPDVEATDYQTWRAEIGLTRPPALA